MTNETQEVQPELNTDSVAEQTNTPEQDEKLAALMARIKEAQRLMDENPVQGGAPLLVNHPLTHVITWFFEELGFEPANRWVEGSQQLAIGGMIEYRNIANNELRRILGLGDVMGVVDSFKIRYLLTKDNSIADWMTTLRDYVVPFIVDNQLLETETFTWEETQV